MRDRYGSLIQAGDLVELDGGRQLGEVVSVSGRPLVRFADGTMKYVGADRIVVVYCNRFDLNPKIKEVL
jgi:hypothetical protein